MKISTTSKFLGLLLVACLVFVTPTEAEPLTSKLGKIWHKYIHVTHGPRLARITAYWPSDAQGDYDTSHRKSATGVRLRKGHCAVDPRIIPYGSMVHIKGVGKFRAVDTGTAVVSRKAAIETGTTTKQRKALVIDIFFPSKKDAEIFLKRSPKFAEITWAKP